MNKKNSNEWLDSLPLPTEKIGFQTEEMIRCGRCQRINPPTKLDCFYCGAGLEISEAQQRFSKPNLRKMEVWEKGCNVIIQPSASVFDTAKLPEIARTLKIEATVLKKIIETGKFLPVARAESESEAEIARRYLESFGVSTIILSDEQIKSQKPPRRLRGIEFFGDKLFLILFNSDEIVEIPEKDLKLIVTGAVFERRIEATETFRRKSENETLEMTEIASDELLFDIYSRVETDGFRISAKGFDFSTLESEKGILANDNLVKFVKKLRLFAPNVKFVDDYLQVRECLANIWEVDQKTDSQGLKRDGIGKFNLKNITTVSNLTQFTKYSRLHRNLL